MSHKLTSNSSVVYNAETQESGILTIELTQLNYEHHNHDVFIHGEVKTSSTNIVGAIYENIPESDWNTFFAAQPLSSSNEYDKQVEAGLLYVKQEIGNKWGLTSSDWVYSNS